MTEDNTILRRVFLVSSFSATRDQRIHGMCYNDTPYNSDKQVTSPAFLKVIATHAEAHQEEHQEKSKNYIAKLEAAAAEKIREK